MKGRTVTPNQQITLRLIDRIRETDPDWPDDPVIIADDVARKLDEAPGDQSYTSKDYGIIIPPFKRFWCEARTFLQNDELVRGTSVEASTDPKDFLKNSPKGTHWIMRIFAYNWALVTVPGKKPNTVVREPCFWIHSGIVAIHVDRHGYMLDDGTAIPVIPHDVPAPPGIETLPPLGIANHVPYLLFAINALHRHCPVDCVEPSRQQRREVKRRTGYEPKSRQYILRDIVITPDKPNKRYPKPSKTTPNRTEPTAHTVRGHMRWYGETGMFGREQFKNTMVFIPAHTRGTWEPTRSRTYRINKPKEEGGDCE